MATQYYRRETWLMTRVSVICEGQTEEAFIKDTLKISLAYQAVYLEPRLISTSSNAKGGALNYNRVKPYIINSLKQDKSSLVTTFFDLYALDKRFPGIEESQKINDIYQKAQFLETALKKDICSVYNEASQRFFPHVQPYEFEGLLFSDISELTTLNSEWSMVLEKLQSIRNQFASPEHINDSYETRPSKRITDTLSKTGLSYRKTTHGPLSIKKIGLDKLCSECKHFAGWYQQLANLGTN